MPIFMILVAVLAFLFLIALLIPIALLFRYRIATSRRRPRLLPVTLNLAGFWVSAVILVSMASIMTLWDPRALVYVGYGFLIGALLGGVGLAASRWEEDEKGVYVTAHRGVVLLVALVVVARIAYGIWRVGTAWPGDAGAEAGWLASAGVSGSMAAGAILIGHSLVYWAGVRYRIRRAV